jgi:hypothetical protein
LSGFALKLIMNLLHFFKKFPSEFPYSMVITSLLVAFSSTRPTD